MKKTYYFQHDYNARNDPKLQAVMIKYGLAGIGAFWCIVEMLYEQDGTLPITSIPSIAYTLHADEEMLKNIVCKMDLFECNKKIFWSRSVRKRLGLINEISDIRRKAAEKRWKSNKKSDAKAMQMQCKSNAKAQNNDANAMQTECKCNAIKEKEIKGNDIKEDKIKEDYKEEGSSLRSEPLSTGAVDVSVKVENYRSEEERKNREYCMAIASFFNQSVQGKQIPQIKKLPKDRMSSILARRKDFGEEAIKEVIIKAASSRFLNGDNDRGFFATFTWIFKPRNFQKIYEGNYDNRECCATTRQETTRAQRDAEFAAHIAEVLSRPDEDPNALPF
nr:MAG TPA: protein of unknown function DUF4373 [Caudoviricetes sp.]